MLCVGATGVASACWRVRRSHAERGNEVAAERGNEVNALYTALSRPVSPLDPRSLDFEIGSILSQPYFWLLYPMRIIRHVVTVLLSFAAAAASAERMYQWVDPDTGTTHLSGKPPVWYRGAQAGPRVFVFDKDRIVDDTGIKLSETERDRLRQDALIDAEAQREAAREKLLQAKRLKAAMEQQQQASVDAQAGMAEAMAAEPATAGPAAPPSLEAQAAAEGMTEEDMRALISAWERQQGQRARETVGGQQSN